MNEFQFEQLMNRLNEVIAKLEDLEHTVIVYSGN